MSDRCPKISYYGQVSRGREHLRQRLAQLRQKQLELERQFEQNHAAGLETTALEALLVALAAEIAALESMIKEQ